MSSIPNIITIEPTFRFKVSSRLKSGFALSIVIALLAAHLWVIRALHQNRLTFFIYLFIVAIAYCWHRSSQPNPVRTIASHSRAWSITLLVTFVLSSLLAIAGWIIREPYDECWLFLTDKPPALLSYWIGSKLVAVTIQQIGLMFFFLPACESILTSKRWAIVVSGCLFGLLHLPCLTLVGLTTFSSMVWMILYCRFGRILPLIVSHATLAILLHGLLPMQWTLNLRVGSEALSLRKENDVLFTNDAHLFLSRVTTEEFYREVGGTPKGFVRALYLELLGYYPQPEKEKRWVGLSYVMSRPKLVKQFLLAWHATQQRQLLRHKQLSATEKERIRKLTSYEYYVHQGGTQAGYIRGVYQELFHRKATEAEVQGWLRLHGISSRLQIVSTLHWSQEYRR